MVNIFEFLREWIQDLQPYPSPALANMRRGPEESSDNPLMLQFFTWESRHPEMSWWKHFETEVPTLADLGVTQVWLPPPNKAMRKTGQGYDAYDLWDLGEFDQKGTIATRWGTKEELVHAIMVAKAHGIDVLIDAVLNHKLGADRVETFNAVTVDPNNRLKTSGPVQEIEGWTAFDFTGRAGKYSELKWNFEHFTGVDWDNRTSKNDIYRIVSSKHKGWSQHVDKQFGNYDYLLGIDIDHRHPDVRKDMLAWGTWVLETTGAMGFRLDAIKHMDRRFLLTFLKTARQLPGRENMFAVAEYWSAELSKIKPYIRTFEGLVSFFDVPLHYNFHNASKAGSKYDLRTIFNNTITQIRPSDAVTFVDNHDTQIGQTLESWVYSNFKLQAYALILLRKDGHPCAFYGDLYPNEECYDATVSEGLKALLRARKNSAYGTQRDYPHEKNCIGFVREGDGSHAGCAVLVSNADDADGASSEHNVRMNLGKGSAGKSYCSVFEGRTGNIDVDADGWGVFSCPFGGLEVWVPVPTQ
ncbi:glycoside hydrolase family 13 protein [Phlebiopsis gigantea 11061_1 CR5-6]|uniref:Glycoside hydrolase family 13 protein n=1 Tax=Phlebiopsis gigantea (strain 11061_1 CR5-6) TaxID=745531 RepID=A0A0C3NLF4_PHLG1|nr:glycoside hydrolase family 13 protein [Phlebiopsis gigantea 11061_1 CR5-6]